jgi:hypothetical protein
MRVLEVGQTMKVRAIAGLHVVVLVWDFVDGQSAKRKRLLGFAIERSELKGAQVIERYFLRGIKRFKDKDQGVPAGTGLPTSEHPVQSFEWGDYTAKPGTTYQYRVVPMYGKAKLLEQDDAASITVEVTTEAEVQSAPAGQVKHDVYFNRGVAASQYYALKFKQTKPDENQPESEQMRWLSRGLYEALTGFIARAAGADAKTYSLRAMLYEFRYLPILKAFKAASKAGADVDVRFDDDEDELNRKAVAQAGIEGISAPQRIRPGTLRHNKFIVLLRNGKPVAVWTGSTNITANGIFGHSNVGHVVWDREIAQAFLDYWTRLAEPDVTQAPLRKANVEVEPTPEIGELPPADRVMTLFSPRDKSNSTLTLDWYASLMGSAERIVCMTFPFNLLEQFAEVFTRSDKTLRFGLFEKDPGKAFKARLKNAPLTTIAYGKTVRAGGSKVEGTDLTDDAMVNFIGEQLSGFSRNVNYIHTKYMLVDPLGDDPIVLTGSANFSKASQQENDENMLVIRGDQRVADIYFGEFYRLFNHLYVRSLIASAGVNTSNKPDAGYLKETAEEWVPAHFISGGRKAVRRKYLLGG